MGNTMIDSRPESGPYTAEIHGVDVGQSLLEKTILETRLAYTYF